MESHRVCLSGPAYFTSLMVSRFIHTVVHIRLCHLFKDWLIAHNVYNTVSSSVGCFCLLAIVIKKMGVKSPWLASFHLFGFVPRTCVAGSYGSSSCSLWEILILFSMAVAPANDPLMVHRVPTSPKPHQGLLLSANMVIIPTDTGQHITMALTCISLRANDIPLLHWLVAVSRARLDDLALCLILVVLFCSLVLLSSCMGYMCFFSFTLYMWMHINMHSCIYLSVEPKGWC